MHKLCFLVPESHLEAVKNAVFDAGAGRYKHYDRVCWQTLGQGQFRGLEGSNGFLGTVGQLEQVDEYNVELLCEDDVLEEVVSALRKAHPYEEPALQAWPVKHFPVDGSG